VDLREKNTVLVLMEDGHGSALTLKRNGFEVKLADSLSVEGNESADCAAILTDIAEEDGAITIDRLEKAFPDSPIVAMVEGSLSPALRKRLFACLQKGVAAVSIVSSVEQAIIYGTELQATRGLQSAERLKFMNKLEWLLWKRNSESRQFINFGVKMVANLRHSIAQGKGVGSLLTQAELLGMQASAEEDYVRIPVSALHALTENAAAVRSWISSLERFASIEDRKYGHSTLNQLQLNQCLENAIRDVEPFRRIQNQRVYREPIRFAGLVQGNCDALELTFRELLTNAFKYSPEDSSIHIICFRGCDSVSIGILNDPVGGQDSGEKIEDAMLPFFRFSNVYNDSYMDEELGLGIGLSVIQDAIQQNNGTVQVRWVMDHTGDEHSRKRFMAELILLSGSTEMCSPEPELDLQRYRAHEGESGFVQEDPVAQLPSSSGSSGAGFR